MNFVFKIFGAPYIFDLYQGSENEKSYFQTFDNGGLENVKLTIHRMVSGQVSYSYLRYNFISASGRQNAFFGMSLVFNNEYCFDVESLYNLFDSVYKTILTNKILLEEINGNSNIQAKYLVRSFADADNEVKRIENIISKNIESQFSDDIRTIDNSFKQGNSSLIRKLNHKKGNGTFLKALRDYNWVSISPDYNDVENLSDEGMANLKVNRDKLQKNMVSISINALKGNNVSGDIKSAENQIATDKEIIDKYLKIQPELQEIDSEFKIIQKQCIELNNVIASNSKQQKKNSRKSKISEGNVTERREETNELYKPREGEILEETTNQDVNKGEEAKKINNIGFFRKRKKALLVLVSSLCLIVALVYLYPKKDKYPDTLKYEQLIKQGDLLLNADSFKFENVDNAIKNYEKAQILKVKINEAPNKVEISKQIAIDTLTARADVEFKKGGTGNTKKIDAYNKSVELINKAKSKYNFNNADIILDQYKQITIAFYTDKINTTDKVSEKKDFAKIILQLDSLNTDAKKILDATETLAKPIGETKVTPMNNTDKNTSKSKADCKVNYNSKEYDADDLYKQLKKGKLEESFDFVISGCNAILNQCPNYTKINDVKSLLKKAQSTKQKKQPQKATSDL